MSGSLSSHIIHSSHIHISRHNWRTFLWGAAIALLLNLALFSLIPILLEPSTDKLAFEQFVPQINMVRIKQDDPAIKQRRVNPPKRQNKEKPKIKEDKAYPVMTKLTIPFEINPQLPAGPDSLELPPMETMPFDINMVQDSFEIAQLDKPLIQVVKIQPVYPGRAKRRGIEGSVEVEFIVNESGIVEDISIIKADPPDIFDKSIINSVSKWRFEPGTIAGIPVRTRVRVPFQFNLSD